MGQANDLAGEMGMAVTFRVFNSSDGSIKCHLYEEDQFVKALSVDEFHRELKMLRKKYLEFKQFKFYERATLKMDNLQNFTLKETVPSNYQFDMN